MINVVVTCTKKKRVGPEYLVKQELSLGSITGDLNYRFERWIDNLDNVAAPVATPKNLYVGDHWAVANSLEQANDDIQLWVCSAGYGLIKIDTKIKPYSATFSMHNDDSVGSTLKDNKDWWSMQTNHRDGEFCVDGQARSLSELASAEPNSPILVVASKNYLEAIKEDVVNAIDSLNEPLNLAIISAGTRSTGELKAHFVECDARFGHLVRGARRSLNVRLARHLLADREVRQELNAKRHLVAATRVGIIEMTRNGLPELARYDDRRAQTDDQIKKFISISLSDDPTSTKSRLLKEFRLQQHKKCEQHRFSILFNLVVSELTEG